MPLNVCPQNPTIIIIKSIDRYIFNIIVFSVTYFPLQAQQSYIVVVSSMLDFHAHVLFEYSTAAPV